MKNPKTYKILSSMILLLSFSPIKAYAVPFSIIKNFGGSSPVASNIIFTNYVVPAIQFLSVGVGVVVLAMIIIGAIQYSASGGNPQTVAAARKKIINAILALVVYALMFALLDFLIPGGIIKP